MKRFAYRGRAAQEIQTSHYPEGGAIAWFIGEGEDTVVLTVNLIDLGFDNPEPGYLHIKDWGFGHEGNADALVEQGICELVCRVAVNPYGSKAAIMRVLS